MSRKLPTRKTVERWIKDTPALEFDGIQLRCKVCDTALSWSVKTHCLGHLESEKHKALASGRATINERQKQFNLDLVKAMIGCNLPSNKLNNLQFRKFLQNCVSGKYTNLSIPTPSTMRGENCLGPTRTEVTQEIISELREKHVWVSVKITNVKTQNIANVFVGGMDESIPTPAHLLISMRTLKTTTADTISECVDDALKAIWRENFENNKERFLLFITHPGSYLKACGQQLRTNYVNLLHVTCLVHGLRQISETVCECYPNINELITSIEKIFLNSPSRKKIFHDNLPNTPLPPLAVGLTHWESWIHAASYYYIHLEDVKSFVQEQDLTDTFVSQAKKAFSDPNIREDLSYIHGHFTKIPSAARSLQSAKITPDYSIVDAINVVFDLRRYIFQLHGLSAERVREKFESVLQENPGFNTMCRIVDLFIGKEVDFSQLDINVPSLKNFVYFKYAPVAFASATNHR